MTYDFDFWLTLHKKDPDAFIKQWKKVMDVYMVRRFNPIQLFKARAAQARLMTKLDQVKDPTARFNLMITIFWEGFHEFRKTVNNVKNNKMELKDE